MSEGGDGADPDGQEYGAASGEPIAAQGELSVFDSRALLTSWMNAHSHNPYPTDAVKSELADKTCYTVAQVSHWFINARSRGIGGAAPPTGRRGQGPTTGQGSNWNPNAGSSAASSGRGRGRGRG